MASKPKAKVKNRIPKELRNAALKPVLITPQMARALLADNDSNRPLNSRLVNHYAEEISRGHWDANGETIKIADTGKLLDGQHRLEGIIKANKAIYGYIVMDIPEKSFQTIDIGRKRSPADALAVHGCEKNPLVVAAALRIINVFSLGRGNYTSFKERERGMTHQKLIQVYEKTRDIDENVARIYQFQNVLNLVSPSVVAALYTVMSKIDEDECEKFWTQFDSGAGLGETSPVNQLRNKLVQVMMHNGGKKPHRRLVIAMIVKAWNLRRQNKRITELKVKEDDEIKIAA